MSTPGVGSVVSAGSKCTWRGTWPGVGSAISIRNKCSGGGLGPELAQSSAYAANALGERLGSRTANPIAAMITPPTQNTVAGATGISSGILRSSIVQGKGRL